MWLYEDKEIDEAALEGYVGFVYLITNEVNGRRYIGKKLLKKTRTKKVKGKRNKKVVTDSDWRDYYGSNAALKEDVERLGTENFKRTILKLCKTKGTCNYWEAKYQMDHEVLESNSFYNDHIWVRVHRSHIKA
jgi:kynurenine formamidase